jgi:DNA-binding GntR family transcriptional regulator
MEGLREIWAIAARQGTRLPGEASLAEQLGASRPLVREALARLETQGLILRRKGADTVVNSAALDVMARFDLQMDYAELLREAGFRPEMELLSSGLDRLDEEQAALLGAEPGAPALRTVKRWRADGRVAMVAIDTLPLPSADVEVDPHEPLFSLVQRVTGEAIGWEVACPSATTVDHTVAGWLEQPEGTASLTVELFGVSRSSIRSFHAFEYHVPGVVRYGFIRSFRP